MNTRARGAQLATTQQVSWYPFTRRARANHPSASQQGSSDNVTTVNQIQSASNDDYTTYLLIMGSISDFSSDDEEISQAIMIHV